jgi:hypothetical protein
LRIYLIIVASFIATWLTKYPLQQNIRLSYLYLRWENSWKISNGSARLELPRIAVGGWM